MGASRAEALALARDAHERSIFAPLWRPPGHRVAAYLGQGSMGARIVDGNGAPMGLVASWLPLRAGTDIEDTVPPIDPATGTDSVAQPLRRAYFTNLATWIRDRPSALSPAKIVFTDSNQNYYLPGCLYCDWNAMRHFLGFDRNQQPITDTILGYKDVDQFYPLEGPRRTFKNRTKIDYILIPATWSHVTSVPVTKRALADKYICPGTGTSGVYRCESDHSPVIAQVSMP